jgi:methylated-DNA-[protein]-cysteine S-methyltransferase
MNVQHHILQRRIATPLGPLTAARSAAGLSGLWFDGQKHHPGALAAPEDDGSDTVLSATEAALAAYFSGRPVTLPPLDPAGTAFQLAVWQALLEIAPGTPDTYGRLAGRLGRAQAARAARAVGAAVGRNPISILIPCHRVVGADGSLTGYAGGLERKKALLSLEGRGA